MVVCAGGLTIFLHEQHIGLSKLSGKEGIKTPCYVQTNSTARARIRG